MSVTTTKMQLADIDKLVPYQNNTRTHSPEHINKFRVSLREFGFFNPVIIDSFVGGFEKFAECTILTFVARRSIVRVNSSLTD